MRNSVALFLSLALVAGGASAATTKQFHRAVPLSANGSVSVDTHNGSIDVTVWNQPSVDVSAVVEPAPHGDHPEDVNKVDIKVTGGGGSVAIETDYSRVPEYSLLFIGSTRELPPVRYTIHVPPSARVRIEDHNASVHVTGLRNDVMVRSHNGGVTVRDLDGGADIETHNGNVDVQFARYTKHSRFDTHNGSFEVSLPAGARFSLRADTHRPNAVSSQFSLGGRSDEGVRRAEVNGGGPELSFEAHNGTLTLRKR